MGKLLKLLPFLVPLTLLSADLCDWQSKTPPDLLGGQQGGSAADNYWFTHVSDVDQVGHKRQFIFGIHNSHPTKYLPVEWLRGDGEVQIAFDRLAPGKCGENAFETANLFREDPKALIRYGPVRQSKKPDAALYIKVQPDKELPLGAGSLLKSRLAAQLQGPDGTIERVDLEFGTQSEGKQFVYTVTNQGSQTAKFRIPAFSQHLNKIAAAPGNQSISKWSADGEDFFADVEKPAQHTIRFEDAAGYKEAQVSIQVLSRDGETKVAGQLTVYLPVLKP